MTQCAKIIVGIMANVGNVFYPTFTNVSFIFSTLFTFLTFFNFHINVHYIYAAPRCDSVVPWWIGDGPPVDRRSDLWIILADLMTLVRR